MKTDEGGRWYMGAENRERIRQKLYRKVDESIDRLIEPDGKGGQSPYEMDFSGREALAEQIGKEFAAMALGENLLQDLWLEIVEEATHWNCPKCDRESPRRTDNKGKNLYDEVDLKTKVGVVSLRLPQFYCGRCRRLFSPLPTAPQARA